MSDLKEMGKCWSFLKSKTKGIASDLNKDVTIGYASLINKCKRYLQAVFVQGLQRK